VRPDTRQRLRRVLYNIHLWTGLLFALAVVPIGLSGSALVWHDGLDDLLHPSRRVAAVTTAGLTPAGYLAAARAALPEGARLSGLRLPEMAGEAVVATAAVPARGRPRQLSYWLDPADGRVLDSADGSASLIGFLHRFHGTLSLPQNGRQVVGWMGVALLVSSLSAVWLWWPRDGRLLRALRWPRVGRTSYNLHRTAGIWIALPMALIALTGIYISFPQTARALFGIEAPPPRRPGPALPLAAPMLGADQALAAAEAELPGARLLQLTLPTEAAPVWRLRLAGGATVTVGDGDGRVARVPTGPAGPATDPLSRTMRRLHDGSGYGPVWQALVFLCGLLPLLFAVTGVMIWLRQRAQHARQAATAAAAAQ
jgi:uncharacterized iron-regulated membrane protein